jgi:hypothetical protein
VSGRSPDRGHRRGRRRLLLPSERRKACQVDLSQSATARKRRPWVAGGARVKIRNLERRSHGTSESLGRDNVMDSATAMATVG